MIGWLVGMWIFATLALTNTKGNRDADEHLYRIYLLYSVVTMVGVVILTTKETADAIRLLVEVVR